MPSVIKQYAHIWGDDPRRLLNDYTYQPELTKKLDTLNATELSYEQIYEIVLWKLNRFPRIDPSLVQSLRAVGELKQSEHRRAEPELRSLLSSSGVALPMASTILRFLNPNVFQIIDDRAYRVALPGKAKYPSKPTPVSEGYLSTSVAIYFQYIDTLRDQWSELPFAELDRILYLLDIKLGNKIGDEA